MRNAVLLLLAALTGCAPLPPAPPTTPVWPAPTAGLKAADIDTTSAPSLLTVTKWLAVYGYEALLEGELVTFTAAYPVGGTPVDTFIWAQQNETPGGNIPPDLATEYGMVTTLETYIPADRRATFLTRVAGRDSTGRQGPWSEWGAYPDTLRP